MSLRAYARHRGVALSAVQKAIESRRVTAIREEAGRIIGIEQHKADEQWTANTDLDQAIRGNGGVLPLGPQAAAPTARDQVPPSSRDQATQPPASTAADGGQAVSPPPDRTRDDELRGELLESKLRQQRADTELREIELAERRGELVSVDEQRKVSARRYRAIRDQVLGIADRLAWLSREDRLKLTSELKRVLHDLSLDAQAESDVGAEERVAA